MSYCFIPLILWGLVVNLSAAYAAGFREISVGRTHAAVWYPSDAPATLQRLGPFDVNLAKEAPIRSGKYAVVVFSHGNGGRPRNHHLTLQAIADAGFVVIAPQHEADDLIGGNKTAQALDYRYVELEAALKAVREDAMFRNYLVPTLVHGVDYSLGGATIMSASGAGFESKRVEQYCKDNHRIDAEFCDGTGFFYRIIQYFRRNIDLRSTPDPFRNPPLVTGRAVVVAPVFQGLDPTKPLSMTELTIITMDDDKIAKPAFHAMPLFTAVNQRVPTRYLKMPGHHFAFIAPFPKRVTDEEFIPIAQDPKGFDRSAFLMAANRIIVESLKGR